MIRRLLLLSLLALTPLLAQDAAPILRSVTREPDYAKAWDLVFLAEGYRAGEEEQFFEAVELMARKLRYGNTSYPLRQAYSFNYHFVFVASEEAVSWKPGGEPRKSRLRSYTSEDGILVTDDARADALALEVAPDVDSIVIVARFQPEDAHDPDTWPQALQDVVTHPDHVRANADMPSGGKRVRQPTIDPDAFVHELGHALFGLGDEYGEYEGALPPEQAWEIALTPNLTTDPTGARWKHIVDSVFEGGGYYAEGVYRPEQACRMRESRSETFCAVCAHTIRSVGEVQVPAAVEITAPQASAQASGVLQPTVRVAWESASSPLYYAVEVYRTRDLEEHPDDAQPVWDDYVEGHVRQLDVPLEPKGGYTLRIFPTNYRDESPEPAERAFRLRKAKAPVQPGVSDGLEAAGH